jgi:hypothetical protein
MRTRATAILAVTLLTLGACANDQSDVADAMIEQAADEGMELEEQCVRGLAEGLSDEDVKSLEEGSDQATSAEGQAILTRMMVECGSAEDIAEVVLAALPDDGSIDKICIAEALKEADLSGGVDSAVTTAMTGCMDLGG